LASSGQRVSFYNEHGGVLLATWLGSAIPLIPSIVFLAGLIALILSSMSTTARTRALFVSRV